MQGVALPGHQTMVLLPTAYDVWPQQVLNRTLGDELAVDSPADAARIRAAFEAAGIACGGWSVPRATGDAETEGYIHGQYAAQFAYFILNYEQWQSRENQEGEYWEHPQDASQVHAFMRGFNRALAEAGNADLELWITFVPNSMLTNAGDDVERAWLSYVKGVALETYVPGDPNLDPARGLAIWQHHCTVDLGIEPVPAVAIVSQGDVVAQLQAVSDPEHGGQVWTVPVAAQADWSAAA